MIWPLSMSLSFLQLTLRNFSHARLIAVPCIGLPFLSYSALLMLFILPGISVSLLFSLGGLLLILYGWFRHLPPLGVLRLCVCVCVLYLHGIFSKFPPMSSQGREKVLIVFLSTDISSDKFFVEWSRI